MWSWSSCLLYSVLCYNPYCSPNLDGFSTYELAFGHKMTIHPVLEVQPGIVVSGTFHTYYDKLKKNLQYLCSRLQRFRSRRTDLINRNKKYHAYQAGQIVYMYQAKGTIVYIGSRKIACYYLRPPVIYKAIGPNQFLLMSLDGVVYPHLVKETRLKPGVIWTTKGNVYTLTQLRQVLSTGVRIAAQCS